MKTCVIMQPTYLPWLGYFDLIKESDVFVILDDVQFSKQSWQQRNKIRSKNGELMLTVPIKHGPHKESQIRDIDIDQQQFFPRKHFKSIQNNYSKCKNYDSLIEEIQNIYSKQHTRLLALNLDFLHLGCSKFELHPNFVLSSTLHTDGNRITALVDICKTVGADRYLSPVGAKAYLEQSDAFEKNNIELSYQSYEHPTYPQAGYKDFISHLSFVDYLFNV